MATSADADDSKSLGRKKRFFSLVRREEFGGGTSGDIESLVSSIISYEVPVKTREILSLLSYTITIQYQLLFYALKKRTYSVCLFDSGYRDWIDVRNLFSGVFTGATAPSIPDFLNFHRVYVYADAERTDFGCYFGYGGTATHYPLLHGGNQFGTALFIAD